MPSKKATKKKTAKEAKKAPEKPQEAPQPQIPTTVRLSDKEIALALSVGKDNPQIRAILQIIDDAEKASLSQLAQPVNSKDHGILAHIAGNYGQADYIKGEIEEKIEKAHEVLLDRQQGPMSGGSY